MDINTFKYRLLDDGMTFIEKGSDHIVGYLSLYSNTDYDEDDTSYDEDISYMCDFDFEHNEFICKPVVLFNSNPTKAFNRFTKNNKTNDISNFNAFVNEYTVRDNDLNIAIKIGRSMTTKIPIIINKIQHFFFLALSIFFFSFTICFSPFNT